MFKKSIKLGNFIINEKNATATDIETLGEIVRKKVFESGLCNYVNVISPLDREELKFLLKEVDFLFWSTPLGVGYGQIMLESILCNTEILCYGPVGDAKEIVKTKYENFYSLWWLWN